MTAYRDALLAQLEKLATAVPEMTRTAEAAADKLIAGGGIYAASQESFVEEAYYRAGGFIMLEPLTSNTALTEKDVLLVGAWSDDDETALAACRRGKAAGAYVVLFSPAFQAPAPPIAALCDAHVVNFALPAGAPIPGADAIRNLPTGVAFNVTALWTWTGELIGACTRKGKTPVLFLSVDVPGGRARNRKYFVNSQPSKRRFHDDLSALPQQPGRLAHQYLHTLRRQVSGLRGAVLDEMAAASGLMANAVRAGGTVHVVGISHVTVYDARPPRTPGWMRT